MILLCLLINCICGLKSLSKYKTQMGVYSLKRKVFEKKVKFSFCLKKRMLVLIRFYFRLDDSLAVGGGGGPRLCSSSK